MGITSDTPADFPAETADSAGYEALYERVSADYAAPLARLARAHEADASLQQDLLQEIHIAIWRSLPSFGGRCALRTWVYRVSHNAAVSWVIRRQRGSPRQLVSLDDFDAPEDSPGVDSIVDESRMLARIRGLMLELKPLDREIFVLYLEGLSMEEIAEIAGLSRTNTATKLHRLRALLAAQARDGASS